VILQHPILRHRDAPGLGQSPGVSGTPGRTGTNLHDAKHTHNTPLIQAYIETPGHRDEDTGTVVPLRRTDTGTPLFREATESGCPDVESGGWC